jgi:hypothetical protein
MYYLCSSSAAIVMVYRLRHSNVEVTIPENIVGLQMNSMDVLVVQRSSQYKTLIDERSQFTSN